MALSFQFLLFYILYTLKITGPEKIFFTMRNVCYEDMRELRDVRYEPMTEGQVTSLSRHSDKGGCYV